MIQQPSSADLAVASFRALVRHYDALDAEAGEAARKAAVARLGEEEAADARRRFAAALDRSIADYKRASEAGDRLAAREAGARMSAVLRDQRAAVADARARVERVARKGGVL